MKNNLTQSSRPGCAGVERPRNSTLVKQVLYFQCGNFKFPEMTESRQESASPNRIDTLLAPLVEHREVGETIIIEVGCGDPMIRRRRLGPKDSGDRRFNAKPKLFYPVSIRVHPVARKPNSRKLTER